MKSGFFLFLFFQISLFAFSVPFGRGPHHIAHPATSPFLPRIEAHKDLFYLLDQEKNSLLVLAQSGKFHKRIDLPLSGVLDLTLRNEQSILLQNPHGIYLFQGKTKPLKQVFNKSGIQPIQTASSLNHCGDFFQVFDTYSGHMHLISRRGNLLSSVHQPFEDFSPRSPTSFLGILNMDRKVALVSQNLSGPKTLLFAGRTGVGKDYLKWKLIGVSQLGNILIQEIHGKDHGVGELSLLVVSPIGTLISRHSFSMNQFEYSELGLFFFHHKNLGLFKIGLNESSLIFEKIEL